MLRVLNSNFVSLVAVLSRASYMNWVKSMLELMSVRLTKVANLY